MKLEIYQKTSPPLPSYLARLMLLLEKIIITHFKNYVFTSFAFTERVIGICGLNGKGKTNLLDAIYYCCFTKSYFASGDALHVNFGNTGFRLEGFFQRQEIAQKVISVYRGNGKKEFSLNDVLYEKFSKHIGLLPVVMIAPDDLELITGGSEIRRKFIDTVLSQIDADYLQLLIHYNKILQQRNILLKNMEGDKEALAVLEILDLQLVIPGQIIHDKRTEFLKSFFVLVRQFYRQISDNAEDVSLQYNSQLNENEFKRLLKENRNKDILLQRSNAGIHKDEVVFFLNNQIFKSIASQGQRKSLLFALKLAEFEILKSTKGFSPLLLLDDVFEKLDHNRMRLLLHWVCNENAGQVFITDTHRERLEQAFLALKAPFQILEL